MTDQLGLIRVQPKRTASDIADDKLTVRSRRNVAQAQKKSEDGISLFLSFSFFSVWQDFFKYFIHFCFLSFLVPAQGKQPTNGKRTGLCTFTLKRKRWHTNTRSSIYFFLITQSIFFLYISAFGVKPVSLHVSRGVWPSFFYPSSLSLVARI